MMITINEVLRAIPHIRYIGSSDATIIKPITLDFQNQDDQAIMWCSSKYNHELSQLKRGTVICNDDKIDYNISCNYIIVTNPRLAFQELLNSFFASKKIYTISTTAKIHRSSVLGQNIFIGENVVIEEGCIIGSNVEIDHNTVIKSNTEISDNVKIGANCTIGGIGFGYEQNEQKKYVIIPHIGNVVLKKNVEIGNNTCIDRAVLGSTILEENVKVDNLVHIAHGVVIGKNSLIIANSMIAGSTKIGENVWVAPSASILNKKIVDNNSFIGMGAVVINDVEQNQIIIGNPGKPLTKSEKKS
ncbi:MAG: hypothetical protein ACKO96_23755 [Flammeovirgaceae bacterium]